MTKHSCYWFMCKLLLISVLEGASLGLVINVIADVELTRKAVACPSEGATATYCRTPEQALCLLTGVEVLTHPIALCSSTILKIVSPGKTQISVAQARRSCKTCRGSGPATPHLPQKLNPGRSFCKSTAPQKHFPITIKFPISVGKSSTFLLVHLLFCEDAMVSFSQLQSKVTFFPVKAAWTEACPFRCFAACHDGCNGPVSSRVFGFALESSSRSFRLPLEAG